MPAPNRLLPRRALLLAVMLPLVMALWPPEAAAQAADQRCFPETNQCVSGRFREYWERNGGLAVFGYPLTPARDERNRDTGQTVLTQWFQRHRLELHPKAPPDDVLLGRLGDDRLRQLGVDWQTLPTTGERQADCLYFGDTRQNVCDQAPGLGFRSYWLAHGLKDPARDPFRQSLDLFGLPLSPPRLETNAAGDTVLTQWFERARFEWHPTQADEFKVLLGLLGDEVRAGSGQGAVVTAGADTIVLRPDDLPPGFTVLSQGWIDRERVSYERTFRDLARRPTGIFGVSCNAGVFPGDQNLAAVTFASIAYDAAVKRLKERFRVDPRPVAGIGDQADQFVADISIDGTTIHTVFIIFRRLNVVGSVQTAALVQTDDVAAARDYARLMASRAVP